MCLTNFLSAKEICKKAVCTIPEMICQRHKSHNLLNASLKHLLASIKCNKYIPLRIRKRNGETSSGRFAVSFFGKLKGGSKGGEAPLASLGCTRTGCIRCKMACRFAKLAYHPHHDYSGFWGVWMRGKQPLKECCFSASASPKKSSETSKGGMIVVLWFFVGDEWRKAMLCFRGLFSACPLPEKNHSATKQATCSCGNCRKTECTFIKNTCMIPLSMFNTPPFC